MAAKTWLGLVLTLSALALLPPLVLLFLRAEAGPVFGPLDVFVDQLEASPWLLLLVAILVMPLLVVGVILMAMGGVEARRRKLLRA